MPYNAVMDFALSEEQRLIVETTRRFVEAELYPREAEVEKTGRVPPELGREIAQKVKALGFYAPNMPENVGGGGLSHLNFALLERELGRASMALSVYWGRPSNILLACEGEQRERYLLPATRGEKLDALAMTEPNAGSDLRGMTTAAAQQKGGDWILNGRKHFISHADIADFFIVFAASGEEEEMANKGGKRKKISVFLVDKGAPGFAVLPGYNSVSHRGYNNGVLEFDNCRLPAAQLLGEPHKGFALANQWLYATRISVAAFCVGRCRRALDMATAHAASRRQFGQTIGRFQGVGFKLANMFAATEAADWLTLAAAARLDAGAPANAQIAAAKLSASEALAMVTDEALQIFGGMGLMSDLPLERFWRDARVERIWDGTSEIQRHIIARELLRPLEE